MIFYRHYQSLNQTKKMIYIGVASFFSDTEQYCNKFIIIFSICSVLQQFFFNLSILLLLREQILKFVILFHFSVLSDSLQYLTVNLYIHRCLKLFQCNLSSGISNVPAFRIMVAR